MKQYQDGLSITVSNKQYTIFADRVLVDKTQKADDEFVFDSIKTDDKVLYFAATSTHIKNKAKSIGFWHTLFLNNLISLEAGSFSFYKKVDEHGEGQYLLLEGAEIRTGAIIANNLPKISKQTKTYELKEFTIKRVKVVLTPKQLALKQQAHKNIIKAASIIAVIFVAFVGQNTVNYYADQEQQAVQVLSGLQGKANVRVIKKDNKKTSYIDKYLPILTKLSITQVWQGNINFYTKDAVLTSGELKINIHKFRPLATEITQNKQQKWVMKL